MGSGCSPGSRPGRQFDEGAAVLEQVLADGQRPQDADVETPSRVIRRTGIRDEDAHLLPQQAARAQQANARRGDIAADQGMFAAVLGADLDRLDELGAGLFAAFGLAGDRPVSPDHLADGPEDGLLLVLFAADALAAGSRV